MKDIKNGEFNVAIDKGTLDSVVCGDNSLPNSEKMMGEVYRILTANGVYMCVSHAEEEKRKHYFANVNKT